MSKTQQLQLKDCFIVLLVDYFRLLWAARYYSWQTQTQSGTRVPASSGPLLSQLSPETSYNVKLDLLRLGRITTL